MTILLVFTNIAFPVIVILMIIAVASILSKSKYNRICDYAAIISVILIAIIVVFYIATGLIISISNLCALV